MDWPWVIAALAVGLELGAAVLGPYGWFIDELYYRACAHRLAWGYVDHPPLSIALLAFAVHEPSAAEAASSSVLIIIGIAPERLEPWFERVDQAGAFECAECVDWRRHRPILLARAPRVPLLQIWPQLKHFE